MEHARAGVLAAACQGWWSRGARGVALGTERALPLTSAASNQDTIVSWLNLARTAGDLHGQTPRNQRLRRRRARSPEAATGRLVAGLQPRSAELPRATRCALRRRRSRAGVLPRGSNCDRAGRLHGEELLLVDGLALVRVEALLRTDGRQGDAQDGRRLDAEIQLTHRTRQRRVWFEPRFHSRRTSDRPSSA